MRDEHDFIEAFLEHAYDPVKAHEYYMRTRELKGRASKKDRAGAKLYEKHQTADAQKKLTVDIKKTPTVMNKKRRIGAAEQKLIRAKSLASRIQDPTLRAEMLKRVSSAGTKLTKVKGKTPAAPKKASRTKVDPRSNKMYNGKPLKPLGQRIEEDETPDVSPTGAKLTDYNGDGLGKGTYADGYVYDPKVGWKKKGANTAKTAKEKNDAERKANSR